MIRGKVKDEHVLILRVKDVFVYKNIFYKVFGAE
jgi:hypothetical protein